MNTSPLKKQYLDAINSGDCVKAKKIEKIFINTYNSIEPDTLTTRELSIRNFKGTCGTFWTLINDRVLPSKIKSDLASYIRSNTFIALKSKKIPELICVLVHNRDDFLKLYYKEELQMVHVAVYSDDGRRLPNSKKIFNITNILYDCRVREAHINSFFYENPINSSLRLELIRETKKTKHKHWTVYLLSAILNLLMNCVHCRKVHLLDASTYKDKNCAPKTITYQRAQDPPRNPMYQSVGFKANPPINFNLLSDIMKLKPADSQKKPKDLEIWIEKIDEHNKSYYERESDGEVNESKPIGSHIQIYEQPIYISYFQIVAYLSSMADHIKTIEPHNIIFRGLRDFDDSSIQIHITKIVNNIFRHFKVPIPYTRYGLTLEEFIKSGWLSEFIANGYDKLSNSVLSNIIDINIKRKLYSKYNIFPRKKWGEISIPPIL
jgi:hypothetical protein